MAFGTGSAEYLIVLAVFVALLAIAFYLIGTKTYVEKGLYWGTYHTFFSLLITFILSRIFVLAFLMYIRYGFLPRLEASKGTAEYPAMERTANVLVILWEFIYTLGCDALLTLLTYAIYVWKRMTEKASPADFPFLLFVNGMLYLSSFTLMIIQFAYSYTNLVFINIGFYIFVLFGLVSAIVMMVYASKISNLIPHPNGNATLTLLKRMLGMATAGGWICALSLIFRSITMLADTIVYQFLAEGSVGQVVWNILFKYIFWVVPELVIAIFIASAYLKTDEFITELSIINIETSRGRTDRIQQLGDKERGLDMEQLSEEDATRRKKQGSVVGGEYSALPIETGLNQERTLLDVEPTLENQLKIAEVDDHDEQDPNAPLINK